MANTAQAKKRSRQNSKRNEHCSAQRSKARTVVKKVQKAAHFALSSGKFDLQHMNFLLKDASKVLDSTADKGVIHKNKAARIKSRMNATAKRVHMSFARAS